MRRTSTLQAAAAALGLLAGFALAPAQRPTLEGEVTPHVVSLAWDASPVHPGTGSDPAGVQADDWGGRLKPAQPVRLTPMRARPPAGRSAPGHVAPRQDKRHAPHPLLLRQRDLATFQAPGRACPPEAENAAMRTAHAKAAAEHAAMREAHAHAAAQAQVRTTRASALAES